MKLNRAFFYRVPVNGVHALPSSHSGCHEDQSSKYDCGPDNAPIILGKYMLWQPSEGRSESEGLVARLHSGRRYMDGAAEFLITVIVAAIVFLVFKLAAAWSR